MLAASKPLLNKDKTLFVSISHQMLWFKSCFLHSYFSTLAKLTLIITSVIFTEKFTPGYITNNVTHDLEIYKAIRIFAHIFNPIQFLPISETVVSYLCSWLSFYIKYSWLNECHKICKQWTHMLNSSHIMYNEIYERFLSKCDIDINSLWPCYAL